LLKEPNLLLGRSDKYLISYVNGIISLLLSRKLLQPGYIRIYNNLYIRLQGVITQSMINQYLDVISHIKRLLESVLEYIKNLLINDLDINISEIQYSLYINMNSLLESIKQVNLIIKNRIQPILVLKNNLI